jgi:ribosomal protein S18 acetylase RimI-like enzyme
LSGKEEHLTLTGLLRKRTLEETDYVQIEALEEICNRAENIQIKFNWGMMRERNGSYQSDFCFYEQGRLVGYAPLDGFGGTFEVTAAVLPSFRNQGVFHALYSAACQEARDCQARELLLVSYPASPAGTAVVRRLGLPYKSSEYRMEASVETIPTLTANQVALETVDAANVAMLSQLLAISFGESGGGRAEDSLLRELERPNKRYFLAKLENTVIGQIGVIVENQSVYIRGVGIAPVWRRQGYGRQLLATTVRQLLAEGVTHFALDVATDNRQALALYEACGFQETTAYDYHAVPL